MKTFQEFILEAYDPEVQGRSQIRTQGQGGRIGAERKKTEPEKRRMKAAGGKTTSSAKDYKPRTDIGTQRPKSTREQQPTQARGSAALSAREAQRKAAQERRAAKSGTKTKTATQLLSKGNKSQTDPNNPKYKPDPKYKPQKASGLTHRERLNKVKKGEKALRDIRLKNLGKTKESELKYPVTGKEVTRRNKKN